MNFKGFLCCFFVIVIINSVHTKTNYNIGDKCTTKDNEPGIFKNLNDCIEYFKIMKKKHESKLFINLEGCKELTDGGFAFCCRTDHQSTTTQPRPTQPPTTQPPTTKRPITQPPTTKRPITQPPTTKRPPTQPPTTKRPPTQPPTTKRLTTQQPTTPKIHSRSEQACQEYQLLRKNFPQYFKVCLDPSVVNGINTNINEFPHMVAIGYEKEGKDPSSYDFDCGGSLISKKYVLTAHHCVNRNDKVPKIVRLGKTSLNNEDGKDCHFPRDVNVTKIIRHEDYNPRTKHHDIGLLELEKSVDQYFNRTIFPACLHNGFEINSELTITGWGYINTKKTRSVWLQKAEHLNEITLDDCKQRFSGEGKIMVDTQICITSPINADSCQGDSGGPLSYKVGETHYIAGVVSYGFSCGSNNPGIYSRVSSYINWIEDIVWPKIETKSQWIRIEDQ